MSHSLLWLVARGPLVWWCLAVASALLGAALGPRMVAAFGSLRARRMLRALGPSREEVPAGESIAAVLTGTLASDREGAPYAALSVALRPETDGADPVIASDVAPGLTLVVGKQRVRIEGAIEVTHGSRAAKGAVDLAKITGDESAKVRSVSAVHAGDRVRVSGVIEALHEADARAGYRGSAPAWKLSPGVAGRVLVAFEGPTASTAPKPLLRALGAVFFETHWIVASLVFGVALLNSAEQGRGPIETHPARSLCRGDRVASAVLASAVPMYRSRALESVALSLSCAADRTRATWEALDVVHRTSGTPCLARAALFEDVNDYERAAKEWARCGTPESWSRAARLSFALGRFREASDALSHTAINPRERDGDAANDALYVHLLAGESRRAAEIARSLAELALQRESVEFRARSTPLLCLEASLVARAGDAGAGRRLRGLIEAHPGDTTCPMLQGWSGGPEARVAITRTGVDRLARAVSWRRFDAGINGFRSAVTRFELDPARRGGEARTDGLLVALETARFDTLTGAWDDAQRTLATVRASLATAEESEDSPQERVVMNLRDGEADLAFARGGPRACGALLANESAALDSLSRMSWEYRCAGYRLLSRGLEPGTDEAFWQVNGLPERPQLRAAVTRGDARAVVTELRSWHAEDGPTPRRAAALTGFVKPSEAPRLRAWLSTEDRWIETDHESVLLALSERLQSAQVLGDRALLEETRAILARHRAALLDEDNAVALLLFSR
ncbi:MAG: hypothetical protein U0326_32055 [Polyangiales bacterium]